MEEKGNLANFSVPKVFWGCLAESIVTPVSTRTNFDADLGTAAPLPINPFDRNATLYRIGALVCVVLVFLTSFVAVVHVHPNDSGRAERSCSLCALAHAGVAVNVVAQPAPIFAISLLTVIAAVVSHSSSFTSSNYIRPPPQA